MRIGIDAYFILSERRGSGRYVYYLIKNLLELDKENQYILFYNFVRKAKQRKEIINTFSQPNVENKIYRIPGHILQFLWNNFHFPHLDLMLGGFDIFHYPFSFNPPPVLTKWLVTVHDLMWYRFPEYHTAKELRGYEKTFQKIKKEAVLVIASSETTKKDLIDFLNVPSQKIRVIYLGVEKEFCPLEDKEFIRRQLVRFGIKKPYFLCVGGAHWNENSARLIEAYSKIRKKIPYPCQLVMVGKKSWFYQNLIINEIKKYNIEDDVILTGYVSDEDLIYLYNGAACLIHPSLWEGFCLPAIEAMACGTPVIASNIPTFKEVAGDAAILVDSYNIDDIAEAMKRICWDEVLRQQMISKGLARAKLFSWEKTARETLAIYEEVHKM